MTRCDIYDMVLYMKTQDILLFLIALTMGVSLVFVYFFYQHETRQQEYERSYKQRNHQLQVACLEGGGVLLSAKKANVIYSIDWYGYKKIDDYVCYKST